MITRLIAVFVALALGASAGSVMPAAASPDQAGGSGDALYGISCNWATNEHGLQVLALDGETGSGVSIGDSGSPVYWCALAGSWDRVVDSCTAYLMARGGDERPALLRTDLRTGSSTVVAPLSVNGNLEWIRSFTIDGSGAAWATWNDSVYSVDLATGVLTFIAALDVSGLEYLTWSSSDDSFYAQGDDTVYRVQPATGHAVSIGPVILPGGEQLLMEGMAVDSAGTFWFSRLEPADYEEPSQWVRQLASASPTLSGAEVAGRFRAAAAEVPIVALVPLPDRAGCGLELPTLAMPDSSTPAVLAATGTGDPGVLTGIAWAAVLGGLGLIIVAARRLRRLATNQAR